MTSQTIGWLLITSSLPKLPAAISSLLLLLQPAAAIVLAAVVLAERPTLLQLGGAVLVCGGILAATRPAPAPRALSDTERSEAATPSLALTRSRPRQEPARERASR